MKQRMSTSLIETQNNTDHPSSAPPAQIGNTGLPHSAPSTLPSSAPQVHPNYRHVRIGSQMVRLVNPADLVHRVHSQHGSSRHPMSRPTTQPRPLLPHSASVTPASVPPYHSASILSQVKCSLTPPRPGQLQAPCVSPYHSASVSQAHSSLTPPQPAKLQAPCVHPYHSASLLSQVKCNLTPQPAKLQAPCVPPYHSSSVSQAHSSLTPPQSAKLEALCVHPYHSASLLSQVKCSLTHPQPGQLQALCVTPYHSASTSTQAPYFHCASQ